MVLVLRIKESPMQSRFGLSDLDKMMRRGALLRASIKAVTRGGVVSYVNGHCDYICLICLSSVRMNRVPCPGIRSQNPGTFSSVWVLSLQGLLLREARLSLVDLHLGRRAASCRQNREHDLRYYWTTQRRTLVDSESITSSDVSSNTTETNRDGAIDEVRAAYLR